MPRQEKDPKIGRESKDSDYIASVAGSVNFDNIGNNSQIKISIGEFVAHDDIEMEEGELSSAEVERLFKEIHAILDSPSRLNLSPENREDMQYIIEGLEAQITMGKQSNKHTLRRFLRFLGDKAPEISTIVSDALNKAR